MYHFFTETEFFTESEAVITGPDVNHIKNVLRMKPGEKLLLSDGKGTNCLCEITELFPDKVLAKILPEEVDDTELPVKVTLYQGLPKADKMEFIIQKCVELGVTKIVPVDTDRAVVKLDAKKEEAKRKRWYGISESAAKQSKRMIVPEVGNVMKFKAAIEAAALDDLSQGLDALIPALPLGQQAVPADLPHALLRAGQQLISADQLVNKADSHTLAAGGNAQLLPLLLRQRGIQLAHLLNPLLPPPLLLGQRGEPCL